MNRKILQGQAWPGSPEKWCQPNVLGNPDLSLVTILKMCTPFPATLTSASLYRCEKAFKSYSCANQLS